MARRRQILPVSYAEQKRLREKNAALEELKTTMVIKEETFQKFQEAIWLHWRENQMDLEDIEAIEAILSSGSGSSDDDDDDDDVDNDNNTTQVGFVCNKYLHLQRSENMIRKSCV